MTLRLRLIPLLLLLAAPALAFDIESRKVSHWAWKPVVSPQPPAVRDQSWAKSPIDGFVLAALEEKGLRPALPVDKRALIRRAYFDLIGLPPPPDAVEAFVKDESPDAFAKLVDGLVASPHFGEWWARHWMDLVRYAETYGHEFDYPIANAWRYRDYLIRAFNADVPYDQFVREHVAGDLLRHPRVNPADITNESVLATAFWWFGEQAHSPVDVRQHQADRIDNQIEVFGKAFLGLTINCARCHDHKFDAISQKDYYALWGIIASSRYQQAMLDPHGRISEIAGKIAALRGRMEAATRAAISALSRDQFLTYLNAATDDAVNNLRLDAQRLARWREALKDDQASQPSHPLFAWQAMARSKLLRDAAFAQLAEQAKRAEESRTRSEHFKTFADGLGDWTTTGWAFSVGVSQRGALNSGAVSHRLRGVLRSPNFTITRPELLYHVAGTGCRIRLVVDGYRMDDFSELLFEGCILKVETGGRFVWLRQAKDVGRYLGYRAHIEIIDDGDGWIALDEVRLADAGAPLPAVEPSATATAILSAESIGSVAEAYADRWARAVEHLRGGSIDRGDNEFLRWVVDHHLMELDGETAAKLARAKSDLDGLERQIPDPVLAPAMCDGNGTDQRIFLRGNYKTLGDAAPRAFLEAMAGSNQPAMGPGSGRRELARRMTDPSNPLLSRVMINRIWHHLLGRGIVASVDDFGVMGQRPSNAPLLDYLVHRFVADGWSIKRTIRSIMLSATYQMSSGATDERAEQIDPDNVLLHRANVRRLEAEAIRDAILAVSGRLDEKAGGPPVEVYLTPFMEGRGRPSSGPLDGDGGRSIYLSVRRNFLPPMLLAFDYPLPISTMGRRSVSNVPAQALILMNDPFVIEQAKRWAARACSDPSESDRQRVESLYLAAFARPPSEQEAARALRFVARSGAQSHEGWEALCHALFNAKEFIFLN